MRNALKSILILFPVAPARDSARAAGAADAGLGLRVRARGRLQARDLRSVGGLFPEARRGEQIHEDRRGRQDDRRAGRCIFALVSSPENLGEDRSLPRDRAAARAPAGADARPRRGSWRAKARRSCTSTAACTPPRWPARSTRRCCLRPRQHARTNPTIKAMLDNVVADAVADDQSGRPADRRRVVHEERRHAVRAVRAAAALPGVRRPRQQPRRLHAEHDRVARHRAHLAAVGAADHLRAAPVGAVPDAHLAAAVLRAGRHRRAVHRCRAK